MAEELSRTKARRSGVPLAGFVLVRVSLSSKPSLSWSFAFASWTKGEGRAIWCDGHELLFSATPADFPSYFDELDERIEHANNSLREAEATLENAKRDLDIGLRRFAEEQRKTTAMAEAYLAKTNKQTGAPVADAALPKRRTARPKLKFKL